MSETLAMPAALRRGRHGRKDDDRTKAREADRGKLYLRPVLFYWTDVSTMYPAREKFARAHGRKGCRECSQYQ